ncbi:MAG: ABC transporter ATP-binding protein [Enterobacterales bacterium]|nr:ABC transporter ATP-binding protein [Enterobacterales bacterium]
MSDSQALIKVNNLSSAYGERKVLFDIDLEVKQGEILVVMGGSGSGKSTLLRNMLGLMMPSQGEILFNGKDICKVNQAELAKLRQSMGVAFQGGALLSSLSVGDNIKLPLRQHTDLDEKTISIMARLKLELMNLAEYEDLMPSELSGGMLKRAGLARAVIMDPKILFFDEPSAGLDPVTSVELDQLILDLREAMNMTIIVVTHELESAFKIADRIAVLFDGKLVTIGSVEHIKACSDERVVNLINRKPRINPLDADKYLSRLTKGS